MTAVAAVAAGMAVLLARPLPGRSGLGARPRWVPRGAVVAAVPAAAVLTAGLLAPGRLVVVVLGAAVVVGAWLLGRSRARRVAARRTSGRVLEACEQLAGELAAGLPPGAALDRVADEWPALAPVASAARVGADVPTAWRAAAATPGPGDLRLVGAAWSVAHRTGAGLADALDRVTDDLRAGAATRRVVDGELASARATARLLAVLPGLALLVGSGSGSDPWRFLLATPPGLACLALGLAFAGAGLGWIELLAHRAERA